MSYLSYPTPVSYTHLEQNEDRQVLELLEYGIEERDIYVDKQSGRSFERTNYMSLRNSILRNGDILVVKSIDRFGRNYSGIRAEWEYLTKTLGVDIVVLDTPILDTTRYKDLLGSVITDIVDVYKRQSICCGLSGHSGIEKNPQAP